ncbi:predicted protein [Postia placenta Mad-698-R]|uniref:GST N-terminal domain-containing protein n=1 Tax=Postia placenta MAD-698-R-SB12 TaxID=670580 RepID=A0A1X6MU18_9APHY|nr:hypothetical protein POSPLADRAFT_1059161 [Postia placenta MAD-698-R-SB12]EED86073.1 predicted protein [Postia placenta Mad-698-R]OSX59874.1 hypothetical protein POSPLADRAFT_1059161 [Postia placenta MAD-698-R-SB12]
MPSSQVIILYDFPSTVPGKACSPNTWKTRLCLNYKGLPHKTIWVEYPDIGKVCKEIGAEPTATCPDGSPFYSVPTIYDPSTKSVVSESARIARYLDKTYPDTPVLIPPETDAFHAAFNEGFESLLLPMLHLVLPLTFGAIHPESRAYFRKSRESWLGEKFGETPPVGQAREELWKKLAEGYTKVAMWLQMDGRDKLFFGGDNICYADITVACFLGCLRRMYGADSAEWADVKEWDGGRWARFMERFDKYEVVHE